MLSIRFAAVAAAVSFGFYGVVPATACNDRHCNVVTPQAETTEPVATTKRKTARKQVRETRRAKQRRIAMERRSFKLASTKGVPAGVPGAIERRFQGFIDPKPLADNPFEILRKPKPDPKQLAGEADPLAPEMWPVMAEDSRNIRFAVATQLREAVPDVIPVAAEPEPLAPVTAELPAAPLLAMPMPQQEVVQTRKGGPDFSLGPLLLMLCGAATTASVLGFIVRG